MNADRRDKFCAEFIGRAWCLLSLRHPLIILNESDQIEKHLKWARQLAFGSTERTNRATQRERQKSSPAYKASKFSNARFTMNVANMSNIPSTGLNFWSLPEYQILRFPPRDSYSYLFIFIHILDILLQFKWLIKLNLSRKEPIGEKRKKKNKKRREAKEQKYAILFYISPLGSSNQRNIQATIHSAIRPETQVLLRCLMILSLLPWLLLMSLPR